MRAGLASIGLLLLNAVVQFVNFILIARAIGPDGYGTVVAVAAVATVSVEFIGLGCGDMLTRTLVRDGAKVRLAFGNALALVLLSFLPVLAGAAVALSLMPLGHAWLGIGLALLVAELVSARSLALSEHLAIASRQAMRANFYRVGFSVSRLGLILLATTGFGVQGLEAWWGWQFGFGLLAGLVLLVLSGMRFGAPILNLRTLDPALGILFATNQVVRALQVNIDRLVMGPVLGATGLGVYGSGARLVQFAQIPAQAVLRLTYPRFHEEGQRGIGAARRQALRVLPAIVGVAAISAAALWLLAPWVAAAMGPGFEPVVEVLRGLAPLPVAIGVQYVYGDVLSGADRQGWRTGIAIGSALALAGSVWLGSQSGGLTGGMAAVLWVNVVTAIVSVGVVEWHNWRESAL